MILWWLINGYTLLVFAAVLLSWIQVSERNPVRRLTDTLVEPVLDKIRVVLPSFGGLDLSPWVLLIALRLLSSLLFGR
jgi:YggT family protein